MISEIGKRLVSYSVPANLIRQWSYCPRVVYYMELTNMDFHRPQWVKQGEEFHQIEEKLWQRRNLSRFNLEGGQVLHNMRIKNDELGLHGIVDMAMETEKTVHAVAFKLSSTPKLHTASTQQPRGL